VRITPSDFHKELPVFNAGDLITYIEGDSWVFIAKDGQPRKDPPVGIVISTLDDVAVRVLWTTGELTMEWRSQIQHYDKYLETKGENAIPNNDNT